MSNSNKQGLFGYRAEVSENTVVDNAPVIRSNPTCPQCRKMQAEIKRLKNIVSEHNLGPVIMKPRNWRDTWAETPDKISSNQNISFIPRVSYNSTEEEGRMRKEIGRLQHELQIRSAEITALRSGGVQQNDRQSRQRASRPSKTPLTGVGEEYSALYLQQWKTAFASLIRLGNKQDDAINTLLTIIKQSYSQCLALANDQLNAIVASSLVKNPREEVQTTQRHQMEVRLDAKQYQRSLQQTQMPNIQKNIYPKVDALIQGNSRIRSDGSVITYINKCIQVCWEMCIQDEPVTIDSNVTRFSQMDSGRYRPFTDEGQYIDYVVWPAALTEAERVIARGVAVTTNQKA